MCQVYTWCIRLITRAWKNRLYRLPPKKDYHVYILHVVSITAHTHDRRKLIGKKKQGTNKERKEREQKRRKREKKAKKEKERKEKTRKARKGKTTRRGSKERKRKKNVILFFFFLSY